MCVIEIACSPTGSVRRELPCASVRALWPPARTSKPLTISIASSTATWTTPAFACCAARSRGDANAMTRGSNHSHVGPSVFRIERLCERCIRAMLACTMCAAPRRTCCRRGATTWAGAAQAIASPIAIPSRSRMVHRETWGTTARVRSWHRSRHSVCTMPSGCTRRVPTGTNNPLKNDPFFHHHRECGAAACPAYPTCQKGRRPTRPTPSHHRHSHSRAWKQPGARTEAQWRRAGA